MKVSKTKNNNNKTLINDRKDSGARFYLSISLSLSVSPLYHMPIGLYRNKSEFSNWQVDYIRLKRIELTTLPPQKKKTMNFKKSSFGGFL